MLETRVIPTLLLKGSGFYKGENFKNHKYVGDPINILKIFNEKEVDEIMILDVDASKNGTPPNFDIINDLTTECFMPLGYGGGVSSIKEMDKLFFSGVEKIAVNSLIHTDPNVVKEASQIFGAQAIIGSLDVKKSLFGKKEIFILSGSKKIKGTPVDYAKYLQDLGIGEILLTSIDHEGTSSGYDLDLISQVSEAVEIPIIASGGASGIEDFMQAKKAGASAVAAGTIFIFYGKHKAVLVQYPTEDELQSLRHFKG